MKNTPRTLPKNPRHQGRQLRPVEPATLLIHGRFLSNKWDYSDHLIPPASASTAYRLESVERGAEGFLEFANPEFDRREGAPIYIYDRLDEPTRGMLEDNLAAVEKGETAIAFATGMAAVSAALGVLVKTGEHVVAHRTIYGCSYSLLANWYPRYNIGVTFTDLTRPENLRKAIKAGTRVVYFESPVNPNLELIDIAVMREVVEAENRKRKADQQISIVVDNTFNTPFCQRPLTIGAHLVIHSLTKGLSGFGTDMGGVVIGPRRLESDLLMYRKDFGGPLAPKAAWSFLVYGLPSLVVRLRHQQVSAMRLASFLEAHPKVARVVYPGLTSHPQHDLARRQMTDFEGNFAPGTLIYFELHGRPPQAKAAGAKMMNWIAKNSPSITLAVSLGQVRSLIEHPASMTHAAVPAAEQAKLGIAQGGIRLSVGLEAADDIQRDLAAALDQV